MLDLGRTFLQAVEREPGRLAFVDAQRRLSYEQWARQVGAAQAALERHELRRGDRIATILQNRFEAATLHWACQMSGIMMVPLNWRSKADEIDYCVSNAEAQAVFYEPVSADNFLAADAAQRLPAIACGDAVQTTHPSYAEWTGAPCDPRARASIEDYAVMLFTSGTTGKPKGVPRRHRTERAAAVAHVAQNLYPLYEVTLGVMPLYHTMGVRSLLALCLVNGTYVALPKWDSAVALELIEKEKVTHLYLVPTLYHDLLSAPGFTSERVRSVRKLGFAGAPMHDALLQKLDKAFRPDLFVNHYGSSEIYTFTINQRAAQKPGSAGRAGINARIRVVKLDTEHKRMGMADLAAPNEEGQIVCELSSDEAFEGYWKREDADLKALRDGWYFTGDTGYVDTQGDLFVTGRVDDMIISGGENISPVEIESVLSLHPSVDEVAVAGLKDERWGQRVVAFVKATGAVDPAALDAHCRQSDLMNLKRPREYVFVKEIPKSPVGKILRRKLVAGEYERA
jgi:2-furoate---CoA ligase